MQQIVETQPPPQLLACIICQKKVIMIEYVEHIKVCEKQFEDVPCSYCKTPIIGAFMCEHLDECMPYIEYRFKQITTRTYDEIECCICCIEMNKPEYRKNLCCGHQYHIHCIQAWFQKRKECPICRQEIH